ncbi:hypothetical protein P4O66_004834 [Electrophorus voltai]|uniref:protein-serine/threonine phosphatase n=1 Tax=Electrophorus voltai TaxID=2609070 RepID=A0AAD8ZX83_9TELE|nr:hypothetical protein P4O66_004834 [Electrophorus voltai]
MDNTSIITQVANPKEEELISSGQEKARRYADEGAVVCVRVCVCVCVCVLFTPVSQSNSSLKKHRSRSIFTHIFCCFRNYNVEPPSSINKPCSLPPPTENGPTPKCDQVEVSPIPSSHDELSSLFAFHCSIIWVHSLLQSPTKYLLPEVSISDCGKNCVVIDLDETLVHSSFKPISNADFIVPVEIDGTIHQVYVLKRPHVDEFLQKMGELFECVLFTASLAKYADPVADLLDRWGVFRARLFRESCVFHRGNYVKDLSRLGRQLSKVIIVDNSPASYIFHPENAVSSPASCGSLLDLLDLFAISVPVQSWFDDMADTELLNLLPLFEGLSREEDVYNVLQSLRAR